MIRADISALAAVSAAIGGVLIRRRRAPIAIAAALGLAGCAASELGPTEAANAAPPEWRVGYTWRLMTEERLLAATRATLDACLVGAPGLENATATATANGFSLVDRTSGERRLWMAVVDDPSYPASKTLNLNWVETIEPGVPVGFLRDVDQTLKGEPAC